MAKDNDLFFYYSPVWFAAFFLSFSPKVCDQRFDLVINFVGSLLTAVSIYFAYKFMVAIVENSPTVFRDNVIFNLSFGFFSVIAIAKIENGLLKVTQSFSGLANFSYTLYLIHFPILLFIFGVFQPYFFKSIWLNFAISFMGILFILAISKFISIASENQFKQKKILSNIVMIFRRKVI